MTLVWQCGEGNGSAVLQCRVQACAVKDHDIHQHLSARNAFIGLEDASVLSEPKYGMRYDRLNEHEKKLNWQEVNTGSITASSAEDSSSIASVPDNNINSPFHGEFQSLQSIHITGLSPNTAYTFRVKQRNAIGWSGWSRACPLVRTSAALPPRQCRLVQVGGTYCVLAWVEMVSEWTTVETEVQQRNAEGGDWHMTRHCRILSMQERLSYGVIDGVAVLIQGLVEGKGYEVRVRVRTVLGWSSWGPTSEVVYTMG
jgi:hypothetical protein